MFSEIVIPVSIPRKDVMDQAVSGDMWVEDCLRQMESKYAALLETTAKITVTAAVR